MNFGSEHNISSQLLSIVWRIMFQKTHLPWSVSVIDTVEVSLYWSGFVLFHFPLYGVLFNRESLSLQVLWRTAKVTAYGFQHTVLVKGSANGKFWWQFDFMGHIFKNSVFFFKFQCKSVYYISLLTLVLLLQLSIMLCVLSNLNTE